MNHHRDNRGSGLGWFRKELVARLAARLAIAGVLCLLLAPVLRVASAAEDGTYLLVTVCTDHGVEQRAVDAAGNPVPADKIHHHVCACCLAAPDQSDQAVLVIGVEAPAAPARVAGSRLVYLAAVFPERHFLDDRGSRAPPVSS